MGKSRPALRTAPSSRGVAGLKQGPEVVMEFVRHVDGWDHGDSATAALKLYNLYLFILRRPDSNNNIY